MKKRVLLGMMSLILAMTMPARVMAYEEEEVVNTEFSETLEGEVYEDETYDDGMHSAEPTEENALEVSEIGENLDTETEEGSYIYDGITVTATKPAVSEIKISGAVLVGAGKTYTYTVSAFPSNASKAVEWNVQPADSGVTIDAKGKLKLDASCSLNSCKVIATSKENPNITATYDVNLNPGLINSMNIYDDGKLVNGGTVTIFRVKGNTEARTSVLPEVRLKSTTGKEFVHTPYKITNKNEDIVTIGEDGRIYAVGNRTGTATITYTSTDGSKINDKAISKTIKVRVANPVTEVQLRLPANRSKYVAKGKTISLISNVVKECGEPWTSGLTYKSSNPTVATVSAKGVVTMKADSYSPVTITATAVDGSGASCSIDLIASNVVKNISMGDFPYTKADNSKYILNVSLSEGKLVLPVIFNEPQGGNAGEKCVCPDIEVISSLPKYLEASYKDGYITLNPLNEYSAQKIVIYIKMLDGSGTVKKWYFKVKK